MWLRGEKNDDWGEKHFCDLPDISDYRLRDEHRIKKWRWMCPVCGRVYRIRDNDMPIGPMFEWVRLMPWTERYWQKRSGIVFLD